MVLGALLLCLFVGVFIGRFWESSRTNVRSPDLIRRLAVDDFASRFLGIDQVHLEGEAPNFIIRWYRKHVPGKPQGYSDEGVLKFPLSATNPGVNLRVMLESLQRVDAIMRGEHGGLDGSVEIPKNNDDSPFGPVEEGDVVHEESPFPSDRNPDLWRNEEED
jgi:hypothetical protein